MRPSRKPIYLFLGVLLRDSVTLHLPVMYDEISIDNSLQ